MGGGFSVPKKIGSSGKESCEGIDNFFDENCPPEESYSTMPTPLIAIPPTHANRYRYSISGASSPTIFATFEENKNSAVSSSHIIDGEKEKEKDRERERERDRDRERISHHKRSSMNIRSSFLNENNIRSLVQEFSNRTIETSYIPASTAFVAATNTNHMKKNSFAVVPHAATAFSYIISPEVSHENNEIRSFSPDFSSYQQHLSRNGDNIEGTTPQKSSLHLYTPEGSNKANTAALTTSNNKPLKNPFNLKIELFSPPDDDSPKVFILYSIYRRL